LEKESLRDDIHKPAESLSKKRQAEKVKDKVDRMKQRREISGKLG